MKDWKEIFTDYYWNATEGRNDKRLNDISSLLSQQRKEVLEEVEKEIRPLGKCKSVNSCSWVDVSIDEVINKIKSLIIKQ